jgi:myo-inositol 2-dehydrogenase/D-chiro-inositol 1-dehydrogenase
MRFALLCDDPLALPIVESLNSQVDGQRLTHAVRITPEADLLLHGLTDLRFVEHWEDLLVSKEIDAVIIGGKHPKILEGAKQIATAGIPILFIPQAEQGSTLAYELSLIHDDNQVLLWPLFWHRFDQGALRLKRVMSDGELGQIQFLQLQRTIPILTPGTPISQSQVDGELLHDIDLPRWLAGDYDQVTGLRTAATSEGLQMQSVVLAGRGLPESNWSISGSPGLAEWKLIVRGDLGVATLTRDGNSRRWIFESKQERVEGDRQQTAREALSAFAHSLSLSREAVPATSSSASSANVARGSLWGDLVKCFETIDATHRSVRRRRTIELHFEPMSERAIFKTQMTAIGCALLVATFLLTLVYLGIASLIPLPGYALIGLRALVFGPLVLFLLAQILLPLTRPSSAEKTSTR